MLPAFSALGEALKRRPLVMGVLNATPDSFSDGGRHLQPEAALRAAEHMLAQGADMLDLGGESTRPGAAPVGEAEELARIVPVAELLAKRLPQAPWSIDTQKAAVAKAALERGACLVNDVSALRQDPAMAALIRGSGAGLVLMHRLEAPSGAAWSTEEADRYGEAGVVAAVGGFFAERLAACRRAGVQAEQVWLDPGYGFGKSVDDNYRLLKGLPELAKLGRPLLVGTSRKSFLGASLGGLPVGDRLEGTAASVALAVWLGASVIRVHEVKEMARVLRVAHAIRAA